MNRRAFCLVLLGILLVALSPISAVASEESSAPATKLEEVLSLKGNLFVKDFYEIAKVRGTLGTTVVLTALVIAQPGQEANRVRGLVVEVKESPGNYPKSSTSFLDPEEIQSVAKSLEYALDLATKWATSDREYSEVVFATKGDFRVGFYQSGRKQQAFCSSGAIGKVSCYFANLSSLAEIKNAMQVALEVLNSK